MRLFDFNVLIKEELGNFVTIENPTSNVANFLPLKSIENSNDKISYIGGQLFDNIIFTNEPCYNSNLDKLLNTLNLGLYRLQPSVEDIVNISYTLLNLCTNLYITDENIKKEIINLSNDLEINQTTLGVMELKVMYSIILLYLKVTVFNGTTIDDITENTTIDDIPIFKGAKAFLVNSKTFLNNDNEIVLNIINNLETYITEFDKFCANSLKFNAYIKIFSMGRQSYITFMNKLNKIVANTITKFNYQYDSKYKPSGIYDYEKYRNSEMVNKSKVSNNVKLSELIDKEFKEIDYKTLLLYSKVIEESSKRLSSSDMYCMILESVKTKINGLIRDINKKISDEGFLEYNYTIDELLLRIYNNVEDIRNNNYFNNLFYTGMLPEEFRGSFIDNIISVSEQKSNDRRQSSSKYKEYRLRINLGLLKHFLTLFKVCILFTSQGDYINPELQLKVSELTTFSLQPPADFRPLFDIHKTNFLNCILISNADYNKISDSKRLRKAFAVYTQLYEDILALINIVSDNTEFLKNGFNSYNELIKTYLHTITNISVSKRAVKLVDDNRDLFTVARDNSKGVPALNIGVIERIYPVSSERVVNFTDICNDLLRNISNYNFETDNVIKEHYNFDVFDINVVRSYNLGENFLTSLKEYVNQREIDKVNYKVNPNPTLINNNLETNFGGDK